jgi:hypothetical protein
VAAVSNTVLRFASEGINHVMFLDDKTSVPAVFAVQARNQHYYPRYGLQGNDAAAVLAGDLNDPMILHGAVVVGWTPVYDTYLADDYMTPAARRCLDIYTKAGLQLPSSNNAIAFGLGVCDEFFYLRDALAAGGSGATAGTFMAGMQPLSDRHWESALTYGGHPTPSRRFGITAIRNGVYNDSCNCFRYQGAAIPLQ